MNAKMAMVLAGMILMAGCMPGAILIKPVPADQQLRETVIHEDSGFFISDKIAVIDVDDIMMNREQSGWMQSGDNPVSLFMEKLDRAVGDPHVRAVVLRLNSPGGTVSASDSMYHALMEFKKKTGKPVIACLLDVAASGAYYLACGCDGIIAQPSTITGSIGTIFQTFSFAGTMKKVGVSAEAIKSGELKDMASPLHDMKEDERKVLTAVIMQFYNDFLGVVLAGRKNLTREALLPLADGRVYTAKQALDNGLVDRIGYPQDAVSWAKELAKVGPAKQIMYHRPLGYTPNIYASSALSQSNPLINIELPAWLRSQGPQFLYLWQPVE